MLATFVFIGTVVTKFFYPVFGVFMIDACEFQHNAFSYPCKMYKFQVNGIVMCIKMKMFNDVQ